MRVPLQSIPGVAGVIDDLSFAPPGCVEGLVGRTRSHGDFLSRLLIQIKTIDARKSDQEAMWKDVATAPFDRDLQLAVIEQGETHALVFACRRILGGWIKSETRERIDVHPTHWREWLETGRPSAGGRG
jgi:hypothetical protein